MQARKQQVFFFIFLLCASVTLCAEKQHIKSPESRPACPAKNKGSIPQAAQKAAEDAKKAVEDQQQAGEQAAHLVKEEYAEKAAEASQAAEAAFEGKKEFVGELSKEMQEVEIVAQKEQSSLKQLLSTEQAAAKALQQIEAEEKLLKTTLELAEEHKGNAVQAQDGVQKELGEKEQLLDTAATKLDQLKKQLQIAKEDLKATKESARKADSAANEAKQNAQRARRKVFRQNTK